MKYLNEKHIELFKYLSKREPDRTTYRDIIKDTSLKSIGSVEFALKTLEKENLIKRTARSSFSVAPWE